MQHNTRWLLFKVLFFRFAEKHVIYLSGENRNKRADGKVFRSYTALEIYDRVIAKSHIVNWLFSSIIIDSLVVFVVVVVKKVFSRSCGVVV